MNSVNSLILKPFSMRSEDEKLIIKILGRPTTPIKLTQEIKYKNRQFSRKFNSEMYDKHKWLCGCEVKNALFCFPCLLFGTENVWTKTGIRDIQHLPGKIKKHEYSACHMRNVLKFSLFGSVNIKELDSEYRISIDAHNKSVAENRYALNMIINCIRFCGSFEMALRDHHDEAASSLNTGLCRGLINLSSELDTALKVHLENATVFKGASSKSVQSEILQCMIQVCHEEITKEIQGSDFLAVIADEIRDVANKLRLVIVFRYICSNGKPVERFWKLLNPIQNDARTLADCIMQEIDQHVELTPTKLIAQSYDGAALMGGSSPSVQAIVKGKYSGAAYVHCHTHQINLILMKAASVNQNVRTFFSNLQSICAFVSTCRQRTSIVDEIVKKRLPHAVPARWHFHSTSVNTVHEYRTGLILCMAKIQNGDQILNSEIIIQASGHGKVLSDENFVFWLEFFHTIMPLVDILFNQQLLKEETDVSLIRRHIQNFEHQVSNIITDIDTDCFLKCEAKRSKNVVNERLREAKEVCDIIICEIKERFSFIGHLTAASLFLASKFQEYSKQFPEENFHATSVAYPVLDSNRLRTELSVLYSSECLSCSVTGALPLLLFICENDLKETFSECVKLLKIIITIPMTTTETERCFSTLKRVKTFLCNTMSEEARSSLALLSIERDFILGIKDFNEIIIEKFVSLSSDRKINFQFR